VRNTHKDKVPPEWIRKQTLVNAERYITEELKEYENKILGAEEKIIDLETRLFNDLVLTILEYIPPVQLDSVLVGRFRLPAVICCPFNRKQLCQTSP